MIRNLYLKILLHWVVALIVTELLIFALFVLVAGDGHRQYFIRSAGQSTVVARDFVQAAVAAHGAGGGPADTLAAAVQRLATGTNAGVWVTGPDGGVIAASFAGAPPSLAGDSKRPGQYGDVTVRVGSGRGIPWHATVPLQLPGKDGPHTLHLFSRNTVEAVPRGVFAAGLALIGALVAVLAVPLALRITRPLKRLQESALRIAGGDLSARADLSQRDEIGRLAGAFNAMAETVERMVRGGRELTANVSHELRSPLARIRVAGECLKEALARGDHEEADAMVQAMWDDIEEADTMIARILHLSRLDLLAPLPMVEDVAPAEMLAGLVKTVGPLAKARGIVFTLDLLPEETVRGNGEWLRTGLKNLLENAVRHTPEEGEVRVAMEREGDLLIIEMTNPHPPLEADELELIFSPFYRGRQSSGEGTGLGLAITRKIILLHHGTIDARNSPQGFLVRISLPCTTA